MSATFLHDCGATNHITGSRVETQTESMTLNAAGDVVSGTVWNMKTLCTSPPPLSSRAVILSYENMASHLSCLSLRLTPPSALREGNAAVRDTERDCGCAYECSFSTGVQMFKSESVYVPQCAFSKCLCNSPTNILLQARSRRFDTTEQNKPLMVQTQPGLCSYRLRCISEYLFQALPQ